MAKKIGKHQDVIRTRARRRRRDDDNGPDRPDPGPGGGTPPPPTTPDPWFPEISVHFYGLNWDLENLPPGNFRQQLTSALTAAFPGMSSRAAFDSAYAGVGTQFSLSIGLWTGAPQPQYDAARRRGLLALRSSGNRKMSAEAVIGIPYLRDTITRAIPTTIPLVQNDILTFSLNLVSSSVNVVLPSTLHVAASYSGSLPSLGPVTPTVDTSITFGASAGNLTLTSTPLNAGDFGAGQLIVQNLFNPFGMAVLVLGGIGLGGFVIHNLGSNLPALPALPALPLPNPASLLPRNIPLDVQKMTLLYRTPDILTRGAAMGTPGLQVLHLPLVWDIVNRVPAVTVSGPTSAALPGGTGEATYHANTTDLVNPTFAWTIGGVAQPGQAGANALLTLTANSTRVGTSRNFVVGVRAVDGAVPTLTASGSITTHGTVIRIDERDSPGGPDGRWG